ncbi:MAG: hypothetical protein NY202_03410 [Mollicutes bacterium UO1]
MNAQEEIRKLKQELRGYQQSLKEISERVKDLNTSDLRAKEKEIADLNTNLLACQQKKDLVQKELDAKIAELQSSNLTKEEKTQQIIESLSESDSFNRELIKT